MNKNTGSSLRVNISNIFTVMLAVDDLFEAVRNANPTADAALLKNILAQIKWISTEITKIGKYIDYILDEHQDHRVSLTLRATFRKMPQQLDKIHCDAIQANLNLISGGDIEEDVNSLQINLYDLRNTVYRSYTSLSNLYSTIETA